MALSYPLGEAPELERIPVRPLLDFAPPPQHLLSRIPSPPNPPNNVNGYTVSTHIIPGSYLRHAPLVTPPSPPSGSTKRERLESATRIKDHLTKLRLRAWEGKLESPRRAVVWHCVNRYLPKRDTKGGVTLFLVHGGGFPKEIWEPVLRYLVNCEQINEVWTWEPTLHGDSALLNKEQESAVYDWTDDSNDILNFLLNFLPPRCSRNPLPTHLSQVSDSELAYRKLCGFKDRICVGIGHSFGGCILAHSAIRHPMLFSSLVLVDPAITPYRASLGRFETSSREHRIWHAIQRRTEWSSRDEALRIFTINPFFATWDSSVLQVYVERGIYLDAQDGIVHARLKNSGIQEAACYIDILTAKEVYQEFRHLSDRIELLWVMPGKKEAHPVGGVGVAEKLVWCRPTNSTNILVPGAGHLIPQEKPREFAMIIGGFLQRKYEAHDNLFNWTAKL